MIALIIPVVKVIGTIGGALFVAKTVVDIATHPKAKALRYEAKNRIKSLAQRAKAKANEARAPQGQSAAAQDLDSITADAIIIPAGPMTHETAVEALEKMGLDKAGLTAMMQAAAGMKKAAA